MLDVRFSFKKIGIILLFFSVLGMAIPSLFSTKKESKLVVKPSNARKNPLKKMLSPNAWVDSVMLTMNDAQKVGQLFMVAVQLNWDERSLVKMQDFIRDNHVGGIIYFNGTAEKGIAFTNAVQPYVNIPILVGLDAEWGISMRLSNTMSFPKQMTLGAIRDNRYIYEMGKQVALQCRRIGIGLNFAPVADVNSNPHNPVIGYRSFGELKENVAEKAVAYMQGLQENGVVACAKHFPGHGDTQVDSHFALPIINHTSERLEQVELYPFRRLIEAHVMSIIVGHLQVPYFDSKVTSLSGIVIGEKLKHDLNFKGLVITDALNMRAVSQNVSSEEVDLSAFLAGNDLILYSENPKKGIERIKRALVEGEIKPEILDQKVRKILQVKYWINQGKNEYISLENLEKDLRSEVALNLKKELYQRAVTLVDNQLSLLPLTPKKPIISVAIGSNVSAFQNNLSQNFPTELYQAKFSDTKAFLKIAQEIDTSTPIIVSLHYGNTSAAKYSITPALHEFITQLQSKNKNVVVCVLGSPYGIKFLPSKIHTLVCGYENDTDAQVAVSNAIMGKFNPSGMLPVSIDERYSAGHGMSFYSSEPAQKIQVSSPKNIVESTPKVKKGKPFTSEIENSIQEIIKEAINQQVFPGCQIAVQHKGELVYYKNFGRLTYDKNAFPVSDNTIYDLASVSKAMGTIQAVMWLYDRQKIDITKKISYYLPELQKTDKSNLIIKDILLHQAGLPAFLPFYEKTRNNKGLIDNYFSNHYSKEYPYEVGRNIFASKNNASSVLKWIAECAFITTKEKEGYPYVYSDLGLILIQQVIERILDDPLNTFLSKNFYQPLGMSNTGYNPLKYADKSQIAPTENDQFFRLQLLQGYVHDPNAALLGGVSGHAGLFSTSKDLLKILQMNLNKGVYESNHFFYSAKTVPYFTQSHSNRSTRGLGWDKVPKDIENNNYISAFASPKGFGHSGFTGTLVWIDPEKDLIFVFLTNRIHPLASNNKINRLKIRKKLMDLVYKNFIQN